MERVKISVAKGDGIGPEIMDAVLKIFNAANVPLEYDFVAMGKGVYDQGVHTGDFGENRANAVGSQEFAQAIINNLDLSEIKDLDAEKYHKPTQLSSNRMMVSSNDVIETVGVDLFIESELLPEKIAEIVKQHLDADMEVTTITNRGTQVWPTGSVFTDLVDTYVVRIEKNTSEEVKKVRFMEQAIRLYDQLNIGSIEMLITINDERKYSLAQGQKVNSI